MNITKANFLMSNTRFEFLPQDNIPEYAFIGRSNVGKSSLINMLVQRKGLAKTSSVPGKTVAINHFIINDSWYIVDLPGYGYAQHSKKQREQWRVMINNYITHRRNLVCTFVLIDSRHDIGAIDLDFLAELGEHRIPFALILTKCDKQGPNVLAAQLERDREILLQQWEALPPVFCASSQTHAGREEILGYIETLLQTT
jgi:GTP-binding protein